MTVDERKEMKGAFIVALVALVVAACAVTFMPACKGAEMPPGTVLVSRWLDESLNTTPGVENHLAMYVGSGEVVEAQADRGVIKTPLAEYLARKQRVTKLLPRTAEIGKAAAERAKSFVGKAYGKLASIDPLWRFGRHNCVSVVEQAYRPETGFVWGIRRPDDVYRLVK